MGRAKLNCRVVDATTRKLCSPAHVWSTTRPNKVRDAAIKVDDALNDTDAETRLKAAQIVLKYSVELPGQRVDVTTNGNSINAPIFVTSNLQLQETIKRISSGE